MSHTFAVDVFSDCYGYHDGQKDVLVQAFEAGVEDGPRVGRLCYSVCGGELRIDHVWTARGWRRQGVATSLLREMERCEPGLPVDWGYTSRAGAALKRAWESSHA